LKNNFFIEVTTGDIITPREINYKYKSIFGEETINIMAYTVETVIAEKFHSIISKNIQTTRLKDFYDLYMLMIKNNDKINSKNLIKALENTFKQRNSVFDINYFDEVFTIIKDSRILENNFEDYRKKLDYVKDINYEDTIKAIKLIIDIIEKELLKV